MHCTHPPHPHQSRDQVRPRSAPAPSDHRDCTALILMLIPGVGIFLDTGRELNRRESADTTTEVIRLLITLQLLPRHKHRTATHHDASPPISTPSPYHNAGSGSALTHHQTIYARLKRRCVMCGMVEVTYNLSATAGGGSGL